MFIIILWCYNRNWDGAYGKRDSHKSRRFSNSRHQQQHSKAALEASLVGRRRLVARLLGGRLDGVVVVTSLSRDRALEGTGGGPLVAQVAKLATATNRATIILGLVGRRKTASSSAVFNDRRIDGNDVQTLLGSHDLEGKSGGANVVGTHNQRQHILPTFGRSLGAGFCLHFLDPRDLDDGLAHRLDV